MTDERLSLLRSRRCASGCVSPISSVYGYRQARRGDCARIAWSTDCGHAAYCTPMGSPEQGTTARQSLGLACCTTPAQLFSLAGGSPGCRVGCMVVCRQHGPSEFPGFGRSDGQELGDDATDRSSPRRIGRRPRVWWAIRPRRYMKEPTVSSGLTGFSLEEVIDPRWAPGWRARQLPAAGCCTGTRRLPQTMRAGLHRADGPTARVPPRLPQCVLLASGCCSAP